MEITELIGFQTETEGKKPTIIWRNSTEIQRRFDFLADR
jgi:hypothetical protein